MNLVFGLGSGRCGTKTLQSLINMQPNSVCFHEVNPSCMAWHGAEHAVISMVKDFSGATCKGRYKRGLAVDLNSPERDKPLEHYLSLEKIEVVGDVASYYLPYVETILEESQSAVFPCLVRDKDEVINSFVNKVKAKNSLLGKFYFLLRRKINSRNHWSSNSKYVKDAKWDRLHPDMGNDLLLRDALSRYYDFYYEEAERLSLMYPNVRLYNISIFDSEAGRRELLEFCGIKNPVANIDVHENSGRKSD